MEPSLRALHIKGLPTCLFGVIGLDAADVRRLLRHEDLHELRQTGFELCGCLKEQKQQYETDGGKEGLKRWRRRRESKNEDSDLRKSTRAEAGQPSPEHWDQCGGLCVSLWRAHKCQGIPQRVGASRPPTHHNWGKHTSVCCAVRRKC